MTAWFLAMFARLMDVPLLLELWEIIMIENDELFPYFFAVALLIKCREVGSLPSVGDASVRWHGGAHFLHEENQGQQLPHAQRALSQVSSLTPGPFSSAPSLPAPSASLYAAQGSLLLSPLKA